MSEMENDKAKNGITQILSNLETEPLLALSTTVTHGFLKNKLTNREDAIEAILKYSVNLKSILRRKIVTRNLLFQYLHDNKVSVSVPITKPELIDVICEFWNLRDSTVQVINQTTPNEVKVEKTPLEIDVMATKFTEWFYTMMNHNEPISVEHFWKDAFLKIELTSSNQSIEEDVADVNEIVRVLFKTKCEHNLYFNANLLSEGTTGRMNPHGLVIISTCGTLHSNNICVGIFEQVFMLARDPFSENNWKIKNTLLKLHSKNNVIKPPSLCEMDLSSNLAILPNS